MIEYKYKERQTNMHENVPTRGDYQYGFHDKIDSLYDTGKGLTEEIVRDISSRKKTIQVKRFN